MRSRNGRLWVLALVQSYNSHTWQCCLTDSKQNLYVTCLQQNTCPTKNSGTLTMLKYECWCFDDPLNRSHGVEVWRCGGVPVVPLVAVLLPGGRGVVIESLRHQLSAQWVLIPGGLLYFGPFVLKPDFNLGFVQSEFSGQTLSPLLGQVSVGLELRLQPLQLLGREGRPGTLVVLVRRRRVLWFPWSGTWGRTE